MTLPVNQALVQINSPKTPLLDQSQKSDTFVISNNSLCTNKYKIAALKVAAFFGSASAKVFFIPISLKLPIGPAFAVGNTTSFFIMEYWAASKTIEKIYQSSGKDNILSSVRQDIKTLSKKTLFFAEIIAILSQIPMGFAAYNYNKDQYKILAASVTIFSGSLFPLRSLQLSLSQTFSRKKLTEKHKKLLNIKNELKALVKENHDFFLSKPLKEKLEFYLSIEQIKTLPESSEKIHQYTKKIFGTQERTLVKHSACRKLAGNCVYLTGHVLNATLQTALAMYTYSQTKTELYDNNYLAGSFSALVVASNVYLMGSSITATSMRIFNSFIDIVSKQSKPSSAEKLRPKLTFLLKILSVIFNGFALGPTIVIWGEFYNSSEIERYYFQSTLCMSIFLILFTAALDTIDDVIEQLIDCQGSDDEQRIQLMSKEFRAIESLLNEISLENMEEFLKKLPRDFQETLLNKFNFTQENLQTFLEDH